MEGRDDNYAGNSKRLRREENWPAAHIAGRTQLDLNLAPGDIRTSHVVPRKLFVRSIPSEKGWATLSPREKLYSHHFARACWAGSRICARQLSPESPEILRILLLMFYGASPVNSKDAFLAAGISNESWEFCVSYATCFLANLGNYLAFGDVKMIPGIPEEDFERIVVRSSSLLDEERQARLLGLWANTKKRIYSLEPGERQLGLYPKGVCMYYIGNITEEEVHLVQEWMGSNGIESWNTRLRKKSSPGNDGLPEFEILIASAIDHPEQTHTYEAKCVIHVLFGDHKEELEEVVLHLKHAVKFAANDYQRAALANYINHFETGSTDQHKQSQKHWLRDDARVNANIGFVETYRDPLGFRAEFEGYVAVADQEQSARFGALADAIPTLLPLLPWPKDFNREFDQPMAFSSLDILIFANGNVPAGINIPNYEDIRQSAGFRNIAFANVLRSENLDEETPFLKESDQVILGLRKSAAMEIQFGCHELLGHGSGKLFVKNLDGTYNYDHGKVLHPFTDAAILSCYNPGDRFDTVFGQLSSSYEECRAECVAVFFSTKEQVLELFGHSGQDAEDVLYTIWLLMIRAGLLALEYFSPETGEWRQPHMQARFAILRVLLAASDREQIRTVGLPAISALMTRLQVYKSTADKANGRALYEQITAVPDYWVEFREVVLAQKRPRPFLLQGNTFETDAGITLKGYETTCEGFVQSFVDRFRSWIPTC